MKLRDRFLEFFAYRTNQLRNDKTSLFFSLVLIILIFALAFLVGSCGFRQVTELKAEPCLECGGIPKLIESLEPGESGFVLPWSMVLDQKNGKYKLCAIHSVHRHHEPHGYFQLKVTRDRNGKYSVDKGTVTMPFYDWQPTILPETFPGIVYWLPVADVQNNKDFR